MEYKISYDQFGNAKKVTNVLKWARIGTGLLAACGIIAAILWSFGGDWQTTGTAFEEMASHLAQGQSVKEAFSTFCLEILNGA